MHPLFENSGEEDIDDLPLFESKELQKIFKEDNEEEVRLMIEKNKDKTRMSMQVNLDPAELKNLKMKHERQIREGKILLWVHCTNHRYILLDWSAYVSGVCGFG